VLRVRWFLSLIRGTAQSGGTGMVTFDAGIGMRAAIRALESATT
jgi:hypothetical protein